MQFNKCVSFFMHHPLAENYSSINKLPLFVSLFDWTPSWSKEDGYPVFRNFTLRPRKALVINPSKLMEFQTEPGIEQLNIPIYIVALFSGIVRALWWLFLASNWFPTLWPWDSAFPLPSVTEPVFINIKKIFWESWFLSKSLLNFTCFAMKFHKCNVYLCIQCRQLLF